MNRIASVLLAWGIAFGAAHAELTEPVVIPLTNYSEAGRLAIHVRLGTNPTYFPYILDTGSFAFFTALGNATAWAGLISGNTTSDTFTANYTGGRGYTGNAAHTDVHFQIVGGGNFTVTGATMGAITQATSNGTILTQWDADINAPTPIPPEPPGQHLFFGTFGAGLFAVKTTTANQTDGVRLPSVLNQVDYGSLTPGWIIHTGGPNSQSATLTVGLTPQLVESFPIILPLNPARGSATIKNKNGTTSLLFSEDQTKATCTVVGGGRPIRTNVSVVFDTGGTLYPKIGPGVVPGSLVAAKYVSPKASVFLSTNSGSKNPLTNLDWTIQQADTTKNLISVGQTGSSATINTGIPLFYSYDVMFDLKAGVVGLRPVWSPTRPYVGPTRNRVTGSPQSPTLRISGDCSSPVGLRRVTVRNVTAGSQRNLTGNGPWTVSLRAEPGAKNLILIEAIDLLGKKSVLRKTIAVGGTPK